MVMLADRLGTNEPLDDRPKRPQSCPPIIVGDDVFVAEVEYFKQLLTDYALEVRMGVVTANEKKLELIRRFIERPTLSPLEGHAYTVFTIGGSTMMADGHLKPRDLTKPEAVVFMFSQLVKGIMKAIEARFGGLPNGED